jgi:transposase
MLTKQDERCALSLLKMLQIHRNLTLQLVWEEYREAHPDGYSYSRFCQLYRNNWAGKLDVVLRQEYPIRLRHYR